MNSKPYFIFFLFLIISCSSNPSEKVAEKIIMENQANKNLINRWANGDPYEYNDEIEAINIDINIVKIGSSLIDTTKFGKNNWWPVKLGVTTTQVIDNSWRKTPDDTSRIYYEFEFKVKKNIYDEWVSESLEEGPTRIKRF